MARDRYQKAKLLYLYELLKQETDEEYPLYTNDVCNKLAERGIPCDRRTLTTDIEIGKR